MLFNNGIVGVLLIAYFDEVSKILFLPGLILFQRWFCFVKLVSVFVVFRLVFWITVFFDIQDFVLRFWWSSLKKEFIIWQHGTMMTIRYTLSLDGYFHIFSLWFFFCAGYFLLFWGTSAIWSMIPYYGSPIHLHTWQLYPIFSIVWLGDFTILPVHFWMLSVSLPKVWIIDLLCVRFSNLEILLSIISLCCLTFPFHFLIPLVLF